MDFNILTLSFLGHTTRLATVRLFTVEHVLQNAPAAEVRWHKTNLYYYVEVIDTQIIYILS